MPAPADATRRAWIRQQQSKYAQIGRSTTSGEKKRTDAIKHSINVPRKHARRDQNKLTAIRYNSGSSSPPYKEINP